MTIEGQEMVNYQFITVDEFHPGISRICINRAEKHNALSAGVLYEVSNAISTESANAGTQAIILTGAGDKFFAAGGDLIALSNVRDEPAVLSMVEEARNALDAVRQCAVPVIAYLNGNAIGGGAELALACDMRMQAELAHIGFIQAKLAITSAWGGGPDLFQLIGTSRATRMMCRCELVDAQLALKWGLADAVIGTDSVDHDIMEFLAPILSTPPQVMRGIKAQARAFRQGLSYEEQRSLERHHLVETWLHEDHWDRSDKILSKLGAKT